MVDPVDSPTEKRWPSESRWRDALRLISLQTLAQLDHELDDVFNEVRVALIRYCAPIFGIVGASLVVYYQNTNTLHADVLTPITLSFSILTSLFLLLAPIILSVTGSMRFCSWLLTVSVGVSLFTNAYTLMGAASPILLLFVQVPVLAGFFLGMRAALVTFLSVCGALVILILYRSEGYEADAGLSGLIGASSSLAVMLLVFGFLMVTSNTRRRIEAEKRRADEANLALGEFVSTLSHEIRNPLNGVLGFAELLDANIREPENQTLTQAMLQSGRYLRGLLDDVLDLSKIEAGKIELVEDVFSIENALTPVMALWRERAQQKGLLFVLNIDPTIPMLVGDPNRLAQIISNFANNACKFTARGAITIVVKRESEDADQVRLQISVEDTGPGMPPEVLEKIFDKYDQGNDQFKEERGAGLGLAISEKFADLMGGAISAESEVGRGSTFYLKIPYNKSAVPFQHGHDLISDDKSLVGIETPRRSDKTILVADDNASNRLLIQTLLERNGYTVKACDRGAKVIDLVTENPDAYGLILLDMTMPDMGGVEVTQNLHSFFGEDFWIPIIAVTGNVLKEQRQECFDAGMDDFVAKPINLGEFTALVNRYMSEPEEFRSREA